MFKKKTPRKEHKSRCKRSNQRGGFIRYFYSVWDVNGSVSVHAVSCSQAELRAEWDYCNTIDNDCPCLGEEFGAHVIDVWESWSDSKLYLTPSQAKGAAMRAIKEMAQRDRLSKCAQRSGKRRVLLRGGRYDFRHRAWRKICGVASGAPYDKNAYYRKQWDLNRALREAWAAKQTDPSVSSQEDSAP